MPVGNSFEHLVGECEQVGENRRPREKVSECFNSSQDLPRAWGTGDRGRAQRWGG
jgi:hypothetical protein